MALFFSRAGDVVSMRPDLVLNKQKKNPKRNQNVLFWLDMKVNQINFQPSELFSSNKIGLLNRVMFFVISLCACNAIGSLGARNFTLSKKPEVKNMIMEVDGRSNSIIGPRKGGNFKTWISKSSNEVSTR